MKPSEKLQQTLSRHLFIWALIVLSVAGLCSGESPDATADELSPAPGSFKIVNKNGVMSFPFDIYRGDIRFDAEINGHKVKLLLDDGFMWDQLLFWGGPDVDALGLVPDGDFSIGEENDENAIAATTASGITLGLPGVEFSDQVAVITPYSSGTSSMWEGSIGQVSATFFKHFVVDINFDTMKITLIEPGKFNYEGKGAAVQWKPMQIGGWSIPGTLHLEDGRKVPAEFMMDLGYNDQAQIATGAKHNISTPKTALPASLGFNIQREEMRGHFARVPRIEIGGFEVKDVLASFVSAEQSDGVFHEVMIGLGLLSRFNLIFDLSQRQLIVEPNDSFNTSFEHNMSGLSLRRGPQGNLVVVRVHHGSPAAKAGVEEEDRILKIDGKPAASYGFWELMPFFERDRAEVLMTISRGGKELEISFVLRRVI